jgi:hypothetical protein
MSTQRKTLSGVLGIIEGRQLEQAVAAKGASPYLDRLGDPDAAMRFLRAGVRSSYLFARYAVPSYAACAFASLRDFPPVDDETGLLLAKIMEMVQGELFTDNIFGRAGECHSHHRDLLEAYAAAGGDMAEVEEFFRNDGTLGFFAAIRKSSLWSDGSIQYARNLLACREDALASFILMPANEELAPRVYERAFASLCREERFDKFRTFLERHVSLDTDEHGPAALDWLDLYLRKKQPSTSDLRTAARKALACITGDRTPT